MDGKPISQEKVETKKAFVSQCGKPVLDITYRPAYDQGGPVEVLQLLHLGRDHCASKCEFLANCYITALLNVSQQNLESCMTHLQYKCNPCKTITWLTLAPTFNNQ